MKIVILPIYLYVLDREIERERDTKIYLPLEDTLLAFFFFLCDLQISHRTVSFLDYGCGCTTMSFDDIKFFYRRYISKMSHQCPRKIRLTRTQKPALSQSGENEITYERVALPLAYRGPFETTKVLARSRSSARSFVRSPVVSGSRVPGKSEISLAGTQKISSNSFRESRRRKLSGNVFGFDVRMYVGAMCRRTVSLLNKIGPLDPPPIVKT